ncbi:MAG TPA: hypothetical protein EYP61_04785 [Candidatus Latescibacteria bacterium]|nr:hypothetical protein [Candidatus Latescibacterota bacterium]
MRWLLILGLGLLSCGGGKERYFPDDGRIEVVNQLQPRPNSGIRNCRYIRAVYYDEELVREVETLVPLGDRKILGADDPEYGSEGKLFRGGTVVSVRIVVIESGTPAEDVKVYIDGNRSIIVTGVVPQSGVIYYNVQ